MNIRDIYRETKPVLITEIKKKLEELNNKEAPERVKEDQIVEIATDYISEFDSIVKNIEEFALLAISQNVEKGSEFILRFTGDLISISEKPRDGRIIKFAQGAPAFIGWRLLILSGALAIELEDFDAASILIREPIEIQESTGLFSHKPLFLRNRLFYPDAFLGYANYPITYIINMVIFQILMYSDMQPIIT